IYKPGIPAGLANDEPAYYFAAVSLYEDRDLTFAPEDLDRAYSNFSYGISNLIVMSNDGWKTINYGKPYIYSLFAVPFYAVAGINGIHLFNAAMFFAMMLMGWAYLARFNSGAIAAFFAFSFFFVSTSFRYVYWMQPEIFNMTMVTAALFFAFHSFRKPEGEELSGWMVRLARALFNDRTGLYWSMVALGLATAVKPTNLAAGIPIFGALLLGRALKKTVLCAVLLALVLLLVAIGQFVWTGQLSPYFGAARTGINVRGYDYDTLKGTQLGRFIKAHQDAEKAALDGDKTAISNKNDWSQWIFTTYKYFTPRKALNNVKYYFIGRHIGIFPYMPFTLICLAMFFTGPRDGKRWLVLVAIIVYIVYFIIFIPHNYHGGQGFIGNRYFVNIYPVFLFMITRIRPVSLLVPGWILGGLFVSQIIFTPFGAPTSISPTLQVHARNYPFNFLPMEINIRRMIPGNRMGGMADCGFYLRSDQGWIDRGGIWIRGGVKAEIIMDTRRGPIGRAVFMVINKAPGNHCTIQLGKDRAELAFGGEPGVFRDRRRIVVLDAGKPIARDAAIEGELCYLLTVNPKKGCRPDWAGTGLEDKRFLGCRIIYLGRAEDFEDDLYHVEWQIKDVPEIATAGQEIQASVVVHNESKKAWPLRWSSIQMVVGARWVRDSKIVATNQVVFDKKARPGKRVECQTPLKAPQEPGTYSLVFDMGLKGLWWFSERDPASVKVMSIEVRENPGQGLETKKNEG
ncbi:hypothetical protein ACFLU6_15275, partial [Acidobacteriota bacterium]